jgi:hypothetical protein
LESPVPSPRETVREAGELALRLSDELYATGDTLVEIDGDDDATNATLRAAMMIQESASEIRRHGLWLIAESEQSRQLGPNE